MILHICHIQLTAIVLCVFPVPEELEGGVATHLELLGDLGLLCCIQLKVYIFISAKIRKELWT